MRRSETGRTPPCAGPSRKEDSVLFNSAFVTRNFGIKLTDLRDWTHPKTGLFKIARPAGGRGRGKGFSQADVFCLLLARELHKSWILPSFTRNLIKLFRSPELHEIFRKNEKANFLSTDYDSSQFWWTIWTTGEKHALRCVCNCSVVFYIGDFVPYNAITKLEINLNAINDSLRATNRIDHGRTR